MLEKKKEEIEEKKKIIAEKDSKIWDQTMEIDGLQKKIAELEALLDEFRR